MLLICLYLWHMDSVKKSYVYLICDPAQNLFKIGVTKNMYTKRMKQLQTGNGCELHLIKIHETFYPYRIEKMLHNKFFSKREEGEWFRLETEDVLSFEKICNNLEETIEALKDNPFFNKNLC